MKITKHQRYLEIKKEIDKLIIDRDELIDGAHFEVDKYIEKLKDKNGN